MVEISVGLPEINNFEDKLNSILELKVHNIELTEQELDISQMDIMQLCSIRDLLIDYGCGISLYEARLIPTERKKIEDIFKRAHILGVKNVLLIFDSGIEEIVENLEYALRVARSFNIKLLLENSSSGALWGPEELNKLKQFTDDDAFGLIFNPLEFVKIRKHPFFHVYYGSRLKNSVSIIRFNDGLFADGQPTTPCCGNGELKELISISLSRSFDGYISVKNYTQNSSLKENIKILRDILKQV